MNFGYSLLASASSVPCTESSSPRVGICQNCGIALPARELSTKVHKSEILVDRIAKALNDVVGIRAMKGTKEHLRVRKMVAGLAERGKGVWHELHVGYEMCRVGNQYLNNVAN